MERHRPHEHATGDRADKVPGHAILLDAIPPRHLQQLACTTATDVTEANILQSIGQGPGLGSAEELSEASGNPREEADGNDRQQGPPPQLCFPEGGSEATDHHRRQHSGGGQVQDDSGALPSTCWQLPNQGLCSAAKPSPQRHQRFPDANTCH
eukprot:CAMPEP_0115178108 /NCGR_PEP_ID=MMETSP0270-20121206/5730_1 /TAXON_ID=71861 /ORGANISM="Scrippsiella trochoidea, Strain CCMP3099" /LENGTH=152 /DNA_ID=CAMNT_0002591059 /DNA_START=201 /DNA_END=659 /DNA_ORIENTATION=-